MQHQILKQPSTLNQFIVVCGLGLLLGIISIWIPPPLLFVGIGGIIYVMIAWSWPEIAVLGILLLTSTIFDINTLPSIPVGFGHFIVTDALVFVLLGIVFLRGMVESGGHFIRTPLDVPLLAFYTTGILSTVIAIYNSTITFNQSLGELRIVNFYLLFFVVTNLVRSEKQLHRLYTGIVSFAIITALLMIVQYLLGASIDILPGRVETLSTAEVTAYGVVRVMPPGGSLVIIIFVSIFVQILFEKTRARSIFYFIQFAVLSLAMILTFSRSAWVSIFIALCLVGLLGSIRDKVAFAKVVIWTVLIGTVILSVLLSISGGEIGKLVDGFTVRFLSLVNPDTVNESSLQARYIENRYALPQIASHPFFGLGLGAYYHLQDFYIHNGYFYMMLKTGLIGFSFFMWFLLLYIFRGIQNWTSIHDKTLKGAVLSFTTVFIGILLASIVSPIFFTHYWGPVLGVMFGLNEAILIANRNRAMAPQLSEELN